MDKFRLIVNSGVKRSVEGFRKGNAEFILIGNYFLWYRKLMVLDSETNKEAPNSEMQGCTIVQSGSHYWLLAELPKIA